MMNFYLVQALLIYNLLFSLISCTKNESPPVSPEWPVVGGNENGNKYSSLDQINLENVQQLEVAWIYNTGDADTAANSQIQCNPIIVNGILYGTSPQLKLFALDAASGEEIWTFSPFDSIAGDKVEHFSLNNNRGVTFWTDHQGDERILYATGHYMNAVDAKTGKLVKSFGKNGKIDLHEGLGRDVDDLFITATSAPSVYKDLLITGTRVSETMEAAPGHIRAFDVRTGEQKWIFHTIPLPGEPGSETWEDSLALLYTGGANNWMGMVIDHDRGIAFAPTGSAAADFYGGKRIGANLYSNCMLALDASTGKLLWYFQYIHHDTWDYDPPAYPVLVTVKHKGEMVDAVAHTSKTGFVYVFDRESGQSLFPIEEVPVDTISQIKGEKLWPTQPFPQKPLPFVRQEITEKDINPFLPEESYQEVKERLSKYRGTKIFTPQSLEGTVITPGLSGGGSWGGPAVDPQTNILYINANEMPRIIRLSANDQDIALSENFLQAGQRLFTQNCTSCHGEDRKGKDENPSLLNVHNKYDSETLIDFLNTGRRMMPAFKHLSKKEKDALAAYLLDLKEEQEVKFEQSATELEEFRSISYRVSGFEKFKTKEGFPAIAPPWGTLTAIDLNTGEHLWQTVLGEDAEMKKLGATETGTENFGGSVVTKGGLIFIAATRDEKFRAFNKRTGELIWETTLPASGFATPSTYEINGRQYVVIACGGGKLGAKSGDAYVAFALPDNEN